MLTPISMALMLQATMGYDDLCSALRMDADHAEAIEMKRDLELKATQCKNEVCNKN